MALGMQGGGLVLEMASRLLLMWPRSKTLLSSVLSVLALQQARGISMGVL